MPCPFRLDFIELSIQIDLINSISVFNSQQYALAIHTASPDLGLALSNFAGDRRSQVWSNLGQTLSTHLHLYLSEFLQPQTWTDLAFIAVAKGPGGFTGTRVGVVTARTLAQQLGIPLFGISTLAAVAWKFAVQTHHATLNMATDVALDRAVDIAVQMPAHREKLYVAIYSAKANSGIEAALSDVVISQQEWQKTLANWKQPYRLVQVEPELGATATEVLELAYQDWQHGQHAEWSDVLPFYGQSPV